MFKAYRVEDTVKIPPSDFLRDVEEVAENQLREEYENTYDEDMGYLLLVTDVDVEKLGKVLSKDGASYHKASFTVYSMKPVVNEILEGEVVEVTEFGVFVRIGPLDALLHVSQIMDDYVEVDSDQGLARGKESGRALRVGDRVRVRVVAVSPPKGVSVGKIGLTCRQPYLGKPEWFREEEEPVKEEVAEEVPE